MTIPLVYFFYPETGCRSLEEVDVLFHHATQAGKPWTSVVKVAKREPLWYGRDGEEPFMYEESDWHKHAVNSRSSDEGHGSSDSQPSWENEKLDAKSSY